jgi:predicted TIM-barrel fold metal-dependent hydrolase
MIIDCHTHLNDYDPEHPTALAERISKLEDAIRRNGVDYALVLSSYTVSPERPSTRELVEALAGKPHFGLVAGISFLHYKERDLRELADLLREGRVKGLKLYPGYEPFYPSDPRLRVVYELAAEFDVPVMIHTGDTFARTAKIKYAHPIHVDDVAVDFPDVKFIICHLGNPWFRDCMEVVYKNRNVFADFSGLVLGDFTSRFQSYLKKQLDELILYAGEPSWLLFGTDWPICSMRSYRHFMDGLKLAQRDKDRILFENAARLFRISVPDAAAVSERGSPRVHEAARRRPRARGVTRSTPPETKSEAP